MSDMSLCLSVKFSIFDPFMVLQLCFCYQDCFLLNKTHFTHYLTIEYTNIKYAEKANLEPT